MKTGKKIAVLALIFVAAAIIYFVWPLGRKEENKTRLWDGSWRRYSAIGRSWLSQQNVTASWCCRRTAGFPSGSSMETK